jgi:NTE family protein
MKKRRVPGRIVWTALICSLCFATTAFSQKDRSPIPVEEPGGSLKKVSSSHLPLVVPEGRLSIGLALEGGGALGLAHIGVLAWMEENHVPVDRISGTSMGALVGALFASGKPIEDVEKLATGDVFTTLFSLRPAYSTLGFRRRQDRTELPQGISIGLRGGRISVGNALIADDRLDALLSDELVSYNTDVLDFDHLPIPFRCVATDLTTLRPKVFHSGSLPFAVRTSISIPGVFSPVRLDDHVFVDGAIVDNLPIDVLRDDLGAQVLIAVHLPDASFATADAASLVSVFGRAYQAGTARNEELSERQAQVVLSPEVTKFSSTDYDKSKALIAAGYAAAEAQRTTLKRYALNDADWAIYLRDRSSRIRQRPGFIRKLDVDGPSSQVASVAPIAKRDLENRPFSEDRIDRFVTDLRGEGASTAYYETFSEAQSGDAAGSGQAADNALTVHLRPNWDGPPYVLLGADVVAMSGNVTSSIFDMRFVDQNFGGYGSELRSTLRLGYFTHAQIEYHRLLTWNGLYIQPSLSITRDPVYYWVDQKRSSERLLQRAGGGLDVGWTINPRLQIALTYSDSEVRWKLVDGADNSPTQHLSGNAQEGGVHASYSQEIAATVSPTGTTVDAFVGALFHTAMSPNTPMARLRGKHSWTIGKVNTINLSGEANTYFRAAVADPFRFTVGGPLRLYASSIDEYRGTDDVLGRLVYLHKIVTLPTGIGEGIYLTGGYEAANIWSRDASSILRQDAFGGVLVSTPVGTLTLGGAIGDAGHRKVFFTFGHLF